MPANRRERIAKGLCPNCGNVNDRIPKYLCSVCLVKENQRKLVWANERIKAGLCPYCSRSIDIKGPYCSVCKEKRIKRNRLRRARDKREATNK